MSTEEVISRTRLLDNDIKVWEFLPKSLSGYNFQLKHTSLNIVTVNSNGIVSIHY